MANPYTSQSATNYNANPPSDDGSHTAGNAVTWAAIKTKLADVLLNFGNAINGAVLAAFNVLFFNTVASQSANYTVAAGDRGKLINASNGATVTLLTAASAQAGFAVTVKNTGTTAASVAPNGTDQIDLKNASITLNPGDALTFVSDGSAWWTGTGLNFVRWGVAGGTADALTLTSKPPIQGLADGQLIAFRAAAANATTTPTLSPDGLGPYTITKFGGQAVAAGDISGALTECLCRYNLANTRLELLNPGTITTLAGFPSGQVASHGQCRLNFTDATHVTLAPFGGNLIRIAGTIFAIPSAGVAALSTNTFINGTSGQALAASTTYFVYLFNNAGTLALDFSTTGHATDTTAGNIGVEIKSGVNTRTLIGMVRTNGSSQFENDNALLGVRSWFNRPALTAAPAGFSVTGFNSALGAVGTAVGIVCWADDLILADEMGMFLTGGTGGGTVTTAVFFDGVASTEQPQVTVTTANTIYAIVSLALTRSLTEGYHTVQMGLGASGLGAAAGGGTLYLDVGVR